MIDKVEGEGRPEPLCEIYIRPMTVSDVGEILEIERRSFESPWTERAFISELTRNRFADYIVACSRDRIVGYAGMWLFLFEAHVTNIAVDPDFRGRRIGVRLLMSLMGRALLRALRRMSLEVRKSNALARSFYEAYGFEFVKIKRGYYTDTGEDAVEMLCRDIGKIVRGGE